MSNRGPWADALRHAFLILTLGLAVLPARADDDCDAPLNRWQPRDAVRQMAATNGWRVERLKIDDGCYEIRATDAQGRAFKAKLDPETLKVLKLKYADRRRDPTRDRDRDDAARPPRARPPDAPASPPAPATDGAPRRTVP